MLTWVVVCLAAGTMVVLAIIMSAILGWANRAFHVEVDPRIEAINEALPGANCGGCGYVGCGEYSEAVVQTGEVVTKCTVGGASCAVSLAQIMGVEVEQTWPYKAVVHCSADYDHRLGRTRYLGEPTCSSANLVAGVQGCTYGCLGLGDCEVSCEYDAIHIENGLAVVDYDACTGCGACARVCPRNIISMVPFKAERMLVVGCSSQDFGNDVRAVCSVGCIGCKACARQTDLLSIEDNLAGVNYDEYKPEEVDFEAAIEKCPMESLFYVGKPLPDAVTATEKTTLERVEADFKTTADDAEWRG